MYLDTVDHFAEVAAKKAVYMKRTPLAFWVSSMMAGAYIGLGIILIFSIGSDADPSYRGLIMGARSASRSPSSSSPAPTSSPATP